MTCDRSFHWLVLSAFCLGAPTTALAQQSAPAFEFYGQLNFGIFHTDDGVENDTYLGDNDNSNSRIGLIWETDLANGAGLKFHFESALGFTGSSAMSPSDNDLDLDWRRTDLRKFEVVYTTPSIGAISFGQGSTATDGITEQDFSGTDVIAYSGLSDLAESVAFNTEAGSATGVTVGSAFSNLDGARRFRLRYDSPDFNGFGFSVSGGEEVLRRGDDREFYDLGLRYGNDYGVNKVAAGLGYSWVSGGGEVLSGSLAMLHEPSGINAAFAVGEQQDGDAAYAYVKLGLIRSFNSLGSTAFSVDYYEGDDFALAGSDSSSVGLAVVQRIDRYNTEIYAAYRRYSYDAPALDTQDIDVAVLGARWKF
ncbi:porin [Sulfitobacter aestuarii]|uniref:Porin n=1 Tax=Sulfitobacter aestuarii TaxID=2161676 RepID=A0ABW5U3H4_9RHOB